MGSVLSADDATALPRLGELFKSGGVFVYPTSTLYGLGGDPIAPEVSARIRRIKRITDVRPYLLLTDEWSRIASIMAPPSVVHRRLMAAGESLPITILFPASSAAPAHLVGEHGMIAIRRTRHEFCRALIDLVESPIISTSANRTGGQPPVKFEDIDPRIIEEADIAIAGLPALGFASTIVRVDEAEIVIVREGATSRLELMSHLKRTSD